ncbi:MAG: hypothetical protein K0U79_18240 [Gammaproteobacteria bacterium]|nr:hypothetical protein [Gammaproteobacteria bacterium]
MRTSHIIVALLLCCALALVRVLGVHVHLAHDADDHAAAAYSVGVHADDHDVGVSQIVSEFSDHVDAHLIQGEIDAESPDETTGKLPSLDLLALLVFCAIALLISARRGTASRAAYDPPPPWQRSYILPLSQAPPLAG